MSSTGPGAGSSPRPTLPSRGRIDGLRRWLTSATVTRPVFAVLRTVWPVATIPRRTIVVTRAKAVHEVLARDTDFVVAPVNGPRIEVAAGPFILGYDRGDQYDREHAVLRRCARRVREVGATGAPSYKGR